MTINPELEQNILKAVSDSNLKDMLSKVGCKEEQITVKIQLGKGSESVESALFCCDWDEDGQCTCFCNPPS